MFVHNRTPGRIPQLAPNTAQLMADMANPTKVGTPMIDSYFHFESSPYRDLEKAWGAQNWESVSSRPTPKTIVPGLKNGPLYVFGQRFG